MGHPRVSHESEKTGIWVVKKILNIFKYLAMALVAVMVIAPASGQRENESQREAKPPRIQIALADISVKALPPEARETLKLIEKGGPYPYDRDGIVFGNFEKRLPIKERGYYNEFTVKNARRQASRGTAYRCRQRRRKILQ